jgi:hypothetical protein
MGQFANSDDSSIIQNKISHCWTVWRSNRRLTQAAAQNSPNFTKDESLGNFIFRGGTPHMEQNKDVRLLTFYLMWKPILIIPPSMLIKKEASDDDKA